MTFTSDWAFVGVPIDSVGRSGGTERAPAKLRELGLPQVLGGIDVGDLSSRVRGDDRDPVTGLIASDDVLAATVEIREAVASALGDGRRPFLAGGCCTELVGAMAAARDVRGKVGLAYLDGHLDLYDGVTSPTGEAADMPVSVVLGLGPQGWVDAVDGPSARPDDVSILGYRDLEESKTYGMRQPNSIAGLDHHSNDDLRAAGMRESGERAARHLRDRSGPFWLHLDVDVLDQDVFPATDYLMSGGLRIEELAELMAPLMRDDPLVGVSIGCYNPEKDPGDRCGRELVDLFGSLLA